MVLVADLVLPTQSINCLLSCALCAKNDYSMCVGHVVAHAQNILINVFKC